jgi:hypothetical protein
MSMEVETLTLSTVPMMTRAQGDKLARKYREAGIDIPNMDGWTEAKAVTEMRRLKSRIAEESRDREERGLPVWKT